MTREAGPVLDPELRRRLEARYADPPRTYHSFGHAAAVASTVVELGGGRAAVLAAWFHDAVYEGRPGEDETRSAELARDWLADDPDAAEVARLVRLTAGHDPAGDDPDGAILCDADLAVLGGPPEPYEAYRRAVRAEYAHLDDQTWREGRIAVLEGLLARPTIYRTAVARQRWEAPARRNLTTELASLRPVT
ncbi:metal-dependent phosphohydrolase [Euzebya sp.]|uniref:HD domain-containing protein n=1 Tax=Euzebya sp. TaxID=1971409 RepID=UPI0035179C0A